MVAGMDAWVNEWKMMNVHRVRNEEWLYFMSLGGVSNPPQIISLELHWSSHSVHQSVSHSVSQSANYHDAIHVLYKLLYMRRPQTHTHTHTRIPSGATIIPLPRSLLCIGKIGLVGVSVIWSKAKSLLCYLHCVLLVELSFRSQVSEELTSWDILHQEEEVTGVLCEPLETNLENGDEHAS